MRRLVFCTRAWLDGRFGIFRPEHHVGNDLLGSCCRTPVVVSVEIAWCPPRPSKYALLTIEKGVRLHIPSGVILEGFKYRTRAYPTLPALRPKRPFLQRSTLDLESAPSYHTQLLRAAFRESSPRIYRRPCQHALEMMFLSSELVLVRKPLFNFTN